MTQTNLFAEFFKSEKVAGGILILTTVVSLFLANTHWNHSISEWFHVKMGVLSIEHWINDGLMTLFFLLVGLELERELYVGELSSWRNAALPVFAALGGMLVPAGIHLLLNFGTEGQRGAGIPMATDIAFSLGVLSLFSTKLPYSVKIFLTALAIADDLGAVLVIAIFYTKQIAWGYLIAATSVFIAMCILNRCRVYSIGVYLFTGLFLWWLILNSGIHATLAGILIAFAIPFHREKSRCPSASLQHQLHYPVALFVLPVFAFLNTFITLSPEWRTGLLTANSLGIVLGLVIGKPTGIVLASYAGTKLKMGQLPEGARWAHIIAVGLLAGIGFTMSIFVSLLAFENPSDIDASRLAVIVGSVTSAVLAILLLSRLSPVSETVPAT